MRKLIFFSTVGPDHDDKAWFPFVQAFRAAKAGVEDVEIFLAGPATGLLRSSVRSSLEGRFKDALDAVLDSGIPIRYSTGCARYRGVTEADIEGCGAKPGDVSELWLTVAEGAQLVPFLAA